MSAIDWKGGRTENTHHRQQRRTNSRTSWRSSGGSDDDCVDLVDDAMSVDGSKEGH